jgi:hypothetical protein
LKREFYLKVLLPLVAIAFALSMAPSAWARSSQGPIIIGIQGASASKSPNDAGFTSYLTEYYSYLTGKYGRNVREFSYIVGGTGSGQRVGDPDNCGAPQAPFSVTQAISDHIKVLIVRPRGSDTISAGCSAGQTDAALQNIYNEGTAAGMKVWMETAAPVGAVGADLRMAATRKAIHDYEIAHFPHIIDMTTGFANSDYTSNPTYYDSGGNPPLSNYNAAGNTLGAQRLKEALGY